MFRRGTQHWLPCTNCIYFAEPNPFDLCFPLFRISISIRPAGHDDRKICHLEIVSARPTHSFVRLKHPRSKDTCCVCRWPPRATRRIPAEGYQRTGSCQEPWEKMHLLALQSSGRRRRTMTSRWVGFPTCTTGGMASIVYVAGWSYNLQHWSLTTCFSLTTWGNIGARWAKSWEFLTCNFWIMSKSFKSFECKLCIMLYTKFF